MAAELTGGSLLSGFISVLFDRMASRDVMILLRGKKDVVKMLDDLKVNLMSVNVVLDDAEEKQLTSPDVKIWLDELTRVIYRADFLMEKIETEASQRAREDEPATTTSKMVIDEGNQILERLNLLLDQKARLGPNAGVPTRSLQWLPAPLVVKESDVVGRDGDKEEIIGLLLSDVKSKDTFVKPIKTACRWLGLLLSDVKSKDTFGKLIKKACRWFYKRLQQRRLVRHRKHNFFGC